MTVELRRVETGEDVETFVTLRRASGAAALRPRRRRRLAGLRAIAGEIEADIPEAVASWIELRGPLLDGGWEP